MNDLAHKISVDLENHFKRLGVSKNDNLCIHADLVSIGVYHKDLPNVLLKVVKKIIGKNGTFSLPLYNYELNKKKFINMDKDYGSKQNSILSKYFFKNFKNTRTSSIFHSHLIDGKLKKKFIKNINYYSFGKNSDFDLFYKNNFKLLLFGCEPKQAATYIHHVENKLWKTYREKKTFTFIIKKNNKILKKKLILKVKKKNINQNLNRIFFLPQIKKITKSAKLRFGKSYIINIRELDVLCTKIFKKNPYIINL